MHKKEASSVSKPIVVDLDGRPVSSDEEEFMMMSEAILDENEGQKSPSPARSHIRITDDLRGHTVAPRRARSTFLDGEMRKHSRLDVVKTMKPMPVRESVTSTKMAIAPAQNTKKSGVTSPVKTAMPSPVMVPTTSPEPAATRTPRKKNNGAKSPVETARPGLATDRTASPEAVIDNAKNMDKTPNSDSIKTALDIDTIKLKDAKKYSFLNKGGHSVYEQKIDLGELSDFDLYGATQVKTPTKQPDMKKLEAYFTIPHEPAKVEKNAARIEARKSGSTRTARVAVERQKKSNSKSLLKFRERTIRNRNKSREEVDVEKSVRKKGKRKGVGSDEKKTTFLQRLLRRKEVNTVSKKEERQAKTPPTAQKT
ncbi:hypothetical protein ANCCAN_04347 [Ancylostoma caninum]|uniref:Uncharacterized protein n=1 Tax=Ancylostoma caninum TaxID=29170 RepID=A0A368H2Q9_ANCCA|nr:hypothetical protein ANCCAN_04347 [Ancylostoma caninum]